jgi:hypothetical protein
MKYTKKSNNNSKSRKSRKNSHKKTAKTRKYFGGVGTILPEDSIHKILSSIHPNFHRLITKQGTKTINSNDLLSVDIIMASHLEDIPEYKKIVLMISI